MLKRDGYYDFLKFKFEVNCFSRKFIINFLMNCECFLKIRLIDEYIIHVKTQRLKNVCDIVDDSHTYHLKHRVGYLNTGQTICLLSEVMALGSESMVIESMTTMSIMISVTLINLKTLKRTKI